jgi:DNA-binding beta-propeller fold protein YncE
MAAILAFAGQATAGPTYRLQTVTTLPGQSPGWDYLTLDAGRGYLFLGRRAAGVSVFDIKTHTVVAPIADSAGANIAALAPEFDRGYTANGDGSTTVFVLSTLKTIARIKLGDGADAAFFDPATRQMVFTMGDSRQLTFMDARTGEITGRLPMDSEQLEAVASDGKGMLYVAERDTDKVAKVDAVSRAIVAEWSLPKCDMPTGVALDKVNGRLFLGCRGDQPVLTVLDVATGQVTAQLEIGRGNDGVVYDPVGHRVFTANGVDANIVIYNQLGPDNYVLDQAVTTRPIARTLAFDPTTQRVYTMTAEGMVDPSRKINRRAAPFYPNTYFDNTFTVLEFAPIEAAPGKGEEE